MPSAPGLPSAPRLELRARRPPDGAGSGALIAPPPPEAPRRGAPRGAVPPVRPVDSDKGLFPKVIMMS